MWILELLFLALMFTGFVMLMKRKDMHLQALERVEIYDGDKFNANMKFMINTILVRPANSQTHNNIDNFGIANRSY